MSTPIVIDDIDEATVEWINQEAERRGVSTERFVLQLIRKAIFFERSQLQTYHDLDALAGTWSEEQENEFLNVLADFEQVDEKLWQ
jgi:hypothetical protein